MKRTENRSNLSIKQVYRVPFKSKSEIFKELHYDFLQLSPVHYRSLTDLL